MSQEFKSKLARALRARSIVYTLVLLLLAVGAGVAGRRSVFSQQSQPAQLPSPSDLSRAFINVAKQVKPAVVNIDVKEKAKRPSGRGFENMPQIPGFPQFDVPRGPQRGTGSGIIISADGYILTNNHVAGDADEIKVRLSDGREFKARRIGTDQDTDLAVIKIDSENLPFAKLGNSDKVEQGEWVIALGSPFGLEQTMTAGIVSAIGRDISPDPSRSFRDVSYIQTDASINPGNSGGPLVNMSGEIVGINTWIVSGSGSNSGVGFAIPVNTAANVYGQLVKSGRVTRGYLGVSMQALNPAIAKSIGMSGIDGALVNDLARDPSAPAAKAGLRSGDVIVEFDGRPVKSPKNLTEFVAETPIGKVVPLKYVREGHTETATVKIAERPHDNEAAKNDGEGGEQPTGKLGISVSPVTPEVVRELKLRVNGGVVVENVDPDGPAADAGVRQGDVIHRVNRAPVNSRAELIAILNSLKTDKQLVLQIERGGQLTFVTVQLD
ncbi:MAG: peptidase [Blastocatellia bacterium AA13]|nr:MAG: peptidase [Blastocatellia bacterium AA13]